MRLGYTLSSEEFDAPSLVVQAERAIQEYVDAGYDHVYVHQIGPDQEGFLKFYEREVLPAFS